MTPETRQRWIVFADRCKLAAVFVAIATMWVIIVTMLAARTHVYTCAEMRGTPPRVDQIAVLPPGYSATMTDLRMWDQHHRLVCDANGKDLPR